MTNTHNDVPTEICKLGRENWCNSITEQIRTSNPPKVIAVHGTWGSGKTSLLLQMYKALGGQHNPYSTPTEEDNQNNNQAQEQSPPKVKAIWFEAWQYQHEPNILAALLKEIRDQLSIPHKIWRDIEEAAFVTAYSILDSVDITFGRVSNLFGKSGSGTRGIASRVKANMEAYQKERYASPLDSVMLKKQLQDAIDKLLNIKTLSLKQLIKKDNKVEKAVIFIDDLDRCEPEVAYRILESIKVYLSLNNCVFVLGMDIKMVDQIIANHYEKELNLKKDDNNQSLDLVKNRSRLYLEKICQDVFYLPVPKPKQRLNLFKYLLHEKEKINLDAPTLIQVWALVEQFQTLPPFPRSIKILANVMITYCNKAEIRNALQENHALLKPFLIICYLYAFHLEIYNLCYSYPSFYNNAFLHYCEQPTAVHERESDVETHPELKRILVYKPLAATPDTDVLSGASEVALGSDIILRRYPHEHLRQVLWIGELVINTQSIPEEVFEKLKL